MPKRFAIAVSLVAVSSAAAPAQVPCPMTYAGFEFAVPHLDLETCPKDLARDGVFCRASVGNDAVHVYVFAQAGDQCLVGFKSYKQGEYEFTVK